MVFKPFSPLNGLPRLQGRGELQQHATRLGHVLMVVWGVLGGVMLGAQIPWIQRFEGQAQSFLLYLRGPVTPPEDIVILAIDEDSLAQGGFYQNYPDRYPFLAPLETWPWQRRAYSIAIERLMAAGARAVAIDLLLVDPSVYGPADDAALAASLDRHGKRVALAAAYEVSGSTGGQLAQLLQPIYAAPTQVGLINFATDPDLRIRQFPDALLADTRSAHGLSDTLPAFAAAALAAAQYTVPPQRGKQLFFYGPEGTFPQISFWHVLDPTNWQLYEEAGTFRDKIVLIGPTASSLQDLKRTPVSDVMPGVEVHANALATLMEGRAIAPLVPLPWGEGGLVGSAVILVGLLLGHGLLRPVSRLVGFTGAILLWGTVAYLALVYGSRTLPVALPVVGLGLSGLTYVATGAVSDRLEEQRVRRTLERYLAPAVVEEILKQGDNYTALTVGRRLTAAVLFSDIRGFSRLSFELKPEETVSLLNTYLDAMVKALLAHRGTIDKFIGDAVMAEFGSPTSQGAETDALNAVQAALAMRAALAELRSHLRQADQPPLFHGIGISYGEVIAGNIGSLQRVEYTVIGDTVNVASRIEGLTKTLGTDILITERLYELVKDQIIAVDYGSHFLAGREQAAVQVYGVIGLKGEADTLYQQVQTDLHRYLEKRADDPVVESSHPDLPRSPSAPG